MRMGEWEREREKKYREREREKDRGRERERETEREIESEKERGGRMEEIKWGVNEKEREWEKIWAQEREMKSL